MQEYRGMQNLLDAVALADERGHSFRVESGTASACWARGLSSVDTGCKPRLRG